MPGSDYSGKLNKELRTVTFEAKDIGIDDLGNFIQWLEQVRYWMRKQKEADGGGRRWVLRQGDPPIGSYMVGTKRWGAEIELVTIKPRKPCKCSSCGSTIEPGATAWRRRPGTYGGGDTRTRFCQSCVDRGGPQRPPMLTVIQGGADRSST